MSRRSGQLPAAVLWDMDGTLIDSEPLWHQATSSIARRYGITMTPELYNATVGYSISESLAAVYHAAGVSICDRDLEADHRDLITEVMALLTSGLPWRPGAREALKLVSTHQIPMALVTNTVRAVADIALHSMQRDVANARIFATTVCGDEVRAGKPAPEPYRKAALALGFSPRDCLAIEDSTPGAQSASRAGCTTLIVPSATSVSKYALCSYRHTLSDLTIDELRTVWQAAAY